MVGHPGILEGFWLPKCLQKGTPKNDEKIGSKRCAPGPPDGSQNELKIDKSWKKNGLGATSEKVSEKVSILSCFRAVECSQSVVNSCTIVDFAFPPKLSKMGPNWLPKWRQNGSKRA